MMTYTFPCCICHKQFVINLNAGEKCPVCENKIKGERK